MRSLDGLLAKVDQSLEKHLETFDRLRSKRGRDLEQTIYFASMHLRRRLRRLMRKSKLEDEEQLEAAIADLALVGCKILRRRFLEADIRKRNLENG